MYTPPKPNPTLALDADDADDIQPSSSSRLPLLDLLFSEVRARLALDARRKVTAATGREPSTWRNCGRVRAGLVSKGATRSLACTWTAMMVCSRSSPRVDKSSDSSPLDTTPDTAWSSSSGSLLVTMSSPSTPSQSIESSKAATATARRLGPSRRGDPVLLPKAVRGPLALARIGAW
jgi:hypothetical protein